MDNDFTTDSIWSDRIRILQSRNGYRFALDSILLAHFLRTTSTDDVLEIGAGNGVIAVIMCNLQEWKSLIEVELQEQLAELCRKNFQRNELKNADVLQMDFKELHQSVPSNSFTLIYSNPPYRKLGAGKLNPS